MDKTNDQAQLCLKLNNTGAKSPCPLCGRLVDALVGLEVFVEGTWEPACDQCIDKHAPALALYRGMTPELEHVLYHTESSETDRDRGIVPPPDIMPATPAIDTERLAAKRLKITVGQYRNRVNPYSETCPRCGEALMGLFISRKDRWACCDACQVMLDAGSISTLPDWAEPSALPPYHVLSDEEIFGAGFEDWFETEKAKPETEAPRPLHPIGEHEIPY